MNIIQLQMYAKTMIQTHNKYDLYKMILQIKNGVRPDSFKGMGLETKSLSDLESLCELCIIALLCGIEEKKD